MTLEQLTAMGLTEEQAKKVLEAEKAVLDGNYVPKSRFNEVNEAKKQAEKELAERTSQIAERDKQLEDIKKSAGDNETLRKQIETLQTDNKAAKEKYETENKAAKEKYEAEIKDLKLNTGIKLSIAGKVHDEELASTLFDKSKLVLGDDGKVIGLDEQLKALQESKAFLFKPVKDGEKKPLYNPVAGDSNTASLAKTIAESMNKESSDNPYAKAWG